MLRTRTDWEDLPCQELASQANFQLHRPDRPTYTCMTLVIFCHRETVLLQAA